MINQAKSTVQLPVKTSLYDANDRIMFIYGADTANTSNTVAQTATMSVSNFFADALISVGQPDPANSSASNVAIGTMFASNDYLYIATANNYLQRVVLTSF